MLNQIIVQHLNSVESYKKERGQQKSIQPVKTQQEGSQEGRGLSSGIELASI